MFLGRPLRYILIYIRLLAVTMFTERPFLFRPRHYSFKFNRFQGRFPQKFKTGLDDAYKENVCL